MEAALRRGYQLAWRQEDWMLNLEKGAIDGDLPEGFHFVDAEQVDPVKLGRCTWKGFGHEEKGPFENWEAEDAGEEWSPRKSYQGILRSLMAPPPQKAGNMLAIAACGG